MKNLFNIFLSSAIIFPRIKNTIKIGTIVIDNIAPLIIANDLVKANGPNNRPSCPVSANIGKKETTTKIRAKNIGRPTCLADLMIISILSLFEIFSFPCKYLCAFSTITIVASTIAPMAIAIPPKLIIFEPIPKAFIIKKVIKTVIGKVIIIINALLK